MLRTIEINSVADIEALDNFRNENREVFDKALSYLSHWALTSYNHVSIMIARDYEMTAFYQHKNGDTVLRQYVIGGIWHPEDKRYSFHS